MVQKTLNSKIIPLELTHIENKRSKLVKNSVCMLMQQLKMRSTIYNPVLQSIHSCFLGN